MKIVMAGLVGLVLSVGIVGAEPVVEGRVRLSSGEAAVGAQVLVFDLADLSRYVRATTDASGQFVVSLGALGQGQGLPEGFGLGQNYPNPFNPGTVIPYQLAADGYVRLEVFNLLGQRVAVLVDGDMGAGRYTAEWDARDGVGQGVAAGVYVYRLTAGGGVATRRMTLVDGAAASTGSAGGMVGSMVGMQGAGEGVYGLTVAGIGLETYVDAAFVVGSGPVEVVVDAADAMGSGKAAQGGVLGDVSNDGRVNISDALIVATYSVNAGIVVPNNGDIQLGDVNGDGRVNISDALIIATYSIDPTNPALPAGIGQPVEAELVALGDLIEAIEPLEGMPGTMIALTGAFEADAEYEVRFDTVAVVGYGLEEGRLTAIVPVLPRGQVQVRVVTAEGQSDTAMFQVLALPAPRMDAAELQQEVVGTGQAMGAALAALTEADGLYSGADAALYNREMAKLNAAWGVLGERIRDLSPEEAALLAQLLDSSGALGILEALAEARAPKATAIGSKHYMLVQADGLSFVLGNLNAVIGPVSLVAWLTPGGQPVGAVLSALSTISGLTKDVIDLIIPTDLERLEVAVQTPVPVGGTGEVVFLGDFATQINVVSYGGSVALEKAVEKALNRFVKIPKNKLTAEASEHIVDFITGILVNAGMNEVDMLTAEALSGLKLRSTGVTLDMSLYRLDVFSLLRLFIPALPTHEISNLLERAGVDLSEATFFAPVEVEDGVVARYRLADAQLTGLAAGTTRLRARAFRFVGWDSRLNLLDIQVPEVVGPMYSARFAVEAANRVPVLAALADRSVVAGESLTIRLSGSDADGDALRYGVSGAPGGSLSGDTFRWTTRDSQVGTHRVVFTVSDGRGGEATRTVTIRVTAPAVPDMVVDRLTLLPADIETHTSVTVQVRVANVGDGRARQALVVLRVNGRVVDSIALDFNAGSETGVEFEPQVLGAGSHSIEVVVDPDGNLTSETVRGNNRVSRTLTLTPPLASARSVVFILDLSGSMDDAAGDGQTRLEAAKAALAQVLAQVPRDGSQEYALTTFGGGCDVRVSIDFTGNPQDVVDYSSGLVADGSTPLAAALRQGQHLGLDEASSDDVLLVLLSDGEETCDGDPVGVARLIGQGVRAKVVASLGTQAKVIKVNAIGFGVEPGSDADQQIQAIAKETGGNYFRANEEADLAVALGHAIGPERVPTLSGQVTDEDGNPIQGALVRLRNMQENTDANGRYLFPAGVQGVDSLIVTAGGVCTF